MTSKSNYIDEVTRLLARLDGQHQENTEPEQETPIPDTQEPIEDIYVYILREREEEEDEQVIDSTLTEPDTNVPPAPSLIQPLPGDKRSERIAYALLSVSLLMVASIILLQLSILINPPIATIVLIPKSQTISLTGTLQLGRVLSPVTISQSQIAPTTGKGHQDAKQATGILTFYNGSNTPQTSNAGTVFTGNDGIQVVTDADTNIPAANPPVFGQATVPAHALHANAQGNIPAYDINVALSSDLTVKNLAAFTGGQDERNFQTVTKADITTAAASLKTTITHSMQAALQTQLTTDEQVQPFPCTPTTAADHQLGQEANEVKVTVSVTCSGVAYDTKSLETRATQLLTTQAVKKLGTGYSELGNPQVSVTQATAHNKTTMLSFSSQGIWVYGLSTAAQEQIKHLIAGKTKQEALHILESQPGIERVSTQWDENTKLPKDIQYIHLVIFAGI